MYIIGEETYTMNNLFDVLVMNCKVYVAMRCLRLEVEGLKEYIPKYSYINLGMNKKVIAVI